MLVLFQHIEWESIVKQGNFNTKAKPCKTKLRNWQNCERILGMNLWNNGQSVVKIRIVIGFHYSMLTLVRIFKSNERTVFLISSKDFGDQSS